MSAEPSAQSNSPSAHGEDLPAESLNSGAGSRSGPRTNPQDRTRVAKASLPFDRFGPLRARNAGDTAAGREVSFLDSLGENIAN